jgi:hypothetical protein
VNYILDLFTAETWEAFLQHGSDVTGFVKAHRGRAQNIHPGDRFICYAVRVSRWCGVLEVISDYYEDPSPVFLPEDDPYSVRFKVKPVVTLDLEFALPIRLPEIWNELERTRSIELNSPAWGGKAALQSSLAKIAKADGELLTSLLLKQKEEPKAYPLSESDLRALRRTETVKASGGVVTVVVPEQVVIEEPPSSPSVVEDEVRESIQKQALLAEVGAKMGYSIWIPKSDRQRVISQLSEEAKEGLIDFLPVNYDKVTFRTIENIDVLWLERSMLVRAFEVEHTTSIYSGLLRMADLLALQPNIDIRLHIVAPDYRRSRVLEEIQRPVFALLQKGPLAESCSFISYDALTELAKERHLSHMTHSIIDEFAEIAEGES